MRRRRRPSLVRLALQRLGKGWLMFSLYISVGAISIDCAYRTYSVDYITVKEIFICVGLRID